MNIVHFASLAEFRAWLKKNQGATKELWIGFWRKDSGRTGLTYTEALDEALCFGWIDGVQRKIDKLNYTNRFTPRKSKSHWSAVNLKRAEELIRQKRMTPSGLAAYEARNPANIAKASFEQKAVMLPQALEKRFRAYKAAWAFFERQVPSYRRTALWWIVSAKRAETQLRRLELLIADSAAGRRLGLFTPAAKRTI
jgi:uncharacterized protein YdeI (YjbR/CyaY-like superfamily)